MASTVAKPCGHRLQPRPAPAPITLGFATGPAARMLLSVPEPRQGPLCSNGGMSAFQPSSITSSMATTSAHCVLPLLAAAVAAADCTVRRAARVRGTGRSGVARRRPKVLLRAAATPNAQEGSARPKVVVLGSGWGAATFMKALSKEDAQKYNITLVSPRNHFLYTPLLPCCVMGSVEERNVLTPMRQLTKGKATFIEAKCEAIDTVNQTVRCGRQLVPQSRADMSGDQVEGKVTFDLDYDILLYAVGAQTNDFNCPGVKEHAFFFKEISDARKVREKIIDMFERASLPTTTPEERAALLSFVVVGGGPTGVEVAADLADFVADDAVELYPHLMDYIKISLIDVGERLLSTYSEDVSEASKNVFESKNIEVLSGCRVVEITSDEVRMKQKADDKVKILKYGCAVWAAGIKENQLTSQLKESLIQKNMGVSDLNVTSLRAPTRGIVVDENLQVRGSAGSIMAIGDAATVRHDRTLPFVEELFAAGDVDESGELDMGELRNLFKAASEQFPQLEAYARYLEETCKPDTSDDPRTAAIAQLFAKALDREQNAFKAAVRLTNERVGSRTVQKSSEAIAQELEEVDANSNMQLDFEEFKDLLSRIDLNLQAFPPTAQVAAQQGKYLADLFAKGLDGKAETLEAAAQNAGPFTYFHKGSLAYLGDGEAAFDLPVLGALTGKLAGVAWKLYETSAQLSWKNRALVGLDWIRSGVFGRDASRI